MAQSTNDDIDTKAVKADIEKLREDFAALKEHIGTLGRQTARRGKNAGQAKVDELSGEIEDMLEQLGSRGRETTDVIESHVRERPMMSLFAAFGVGMLISQLLSGRHR